MNSSVAIVAVASIVVGCGGTAESTSHAALAVEVRNQDRRTYSETYSESVAGSANRALLELATGLMEILSLGEGNCATDVVVYYGLDRNQILITTEYHTNSDCSSMLEESIEALGDETLNYVQEFIANG